MKYIVATHNGEEVVVLFSEAIEHYAMGSGLRESALRASSNWENSILSAGFFKLDEHGDVEVYGMSESLDIRPAPGDGGRIRQYLAGI